VSSRDTPIAALCVCVCVCVCVYTGVCSTRKTDRGVGGAVTTYLYCAVRLKLTVTWFVCKAPVRTAQETLSVSVIQTSPLILYREIIAVCSEIHTKHINTLCGQNVELLNVKLAVHVVTTGGTYSDNW